MKSVRGQVPHPKAAINPMKIGIVNPSLESVGGIQEMMCQTVAHLDHHQWALYLLRHAPEVIEQYYPTLGAIPVHKLTVFHRTTRVPDRLNSVELGHLLEILRFATLSSDDDVLLAFHPFATSVALTHKPVVWYANCPLRYLYEPEIAAELGQPSSFTRLLRAFLRSADRRIVRRMVGVVCNSRHMQRKLKRYLGLDADVVYPGADTSRASAKRREYGDYFLCPVRLVRSKRVDLVIEAARLAPGCRVKIVGTGYDEDRLRHLSKDVPNVEIHPPVKDIYDEYACCLGVVYLPQDEDFGLVPVEAMACGKPVIAANEGGPRETVLDGETGFLVPAEPGAVAEKMRLLRSSPSLSRSLGEAGIERAAFFSWRRYAAELDAVLCGAKANSSR